jgi:hypothetical protein
MKAGKNVRSMLNRFLPALARKFATTHDMTVKAEIGRLSNELAKLDQPWVFSPM